MFSNQTELHDLRAENRCLSRKCDQFKQLFYEALEPVDEVFQESRDNPNPILKDYVQLGESKFEAVKRLAKDYVDLRAENERLKDEISALEWFFGRAATLKAVEIQEFRRKHPTVFPDTK